MKLPTEMKENIKQVVLMRSFRARICVLVLTVGILTSVLMRHAVMQTYEDRAVNQRTATVQNQLLVVARHLVSNNYFSTYRLEDPALMASRQGINSELDTISNIYEGRIMIINKSCRVILDTYGISQGKNIISEEVIKCFHGENVTHYDKENGYIEMTIPIVSTGMDGKATIVGVMLASVSNETIVSMMDVMNRNALTLEILMI
ncbi:MAG: two-component sensor histidine kinase, partial [Lachnospiraceae bacterium]|nr:two-component sensor histidine kinase [Lachnospiraceae bacterium]